MDRHGLVRWDDTLPVGVAAFDTLHPCTLRIRILSCQLHLFSGMSLHKLLRDDARHTRLTLTHFYMHGGHTNQHMPCGCHPLLLRGVQIHTFHHGAQLILRSALHNLCVRQSAYYCHILVLHLIRVQEHGAVCLLNLQTVLQLSQLHEHITGASGQVHTLGLYGVKIFILSSLVVEEILLEDVLCHLLGCERTHHVITCEDVCKHFLCILGNCLILCQTLLILAVVSFCCSHNLNPLKGRVLPFRIEN